MEKKIIGLPKPWDIDDSLFNYFFKKNYWLLFLKKVCTWQFIKIGKSFFFLKKAVKAIAIKIQR